MTPVPIQTRLAQLALRRERSKMREALLGPDFDGAEDGSKLPPGKRGRARAITRDYREIEALIRGDGSALLMPAERAALDQMAAAQKRELGELLTPEEIARHEIETGPIVDDIRRRVRGLELSEAEFLAVYENFKNERAATRRTPAVERELEEQAMAALGPERGLAYVRATNFEFQALSALTVRAGLPPGSAERVFDLRDRLGRESQRIGADREMLPADKVSALAALGKHTRESVTAELGSSASAAYLRLADIWIAAAENGEGGSVLRVGCTQPVCDPSRPGE